jgi:hypothetical protein
MVNLALLDFRKPHRRAPAPLSGTVGQFGVDENRRIFRRILPSVSTPDHWQNRQTIVRSSISRIFFMPLASCDNTYKTG